MALKDLRYKDRSDSSLYPPPALSAGGGVVISNELKLLLSEKIKGLFDNFGSFQTSGGGGVLTLVSDFPEVCFLIGGHVCHSMTEGGVGGAPAPIRDDLQSDLRAKSGERDPQPPAPAQECVPAFVVVTVSR